MAASRSRLVADHPDIGADRRDAADALEFLLLQDTQQSDLSLGGKLSDFV
jgi:hypothetical protein